VSTSFLSNQQTNGSIAFLSSIIGFLILGLPQEVEDTFNLILFTSFIGILLSKFDIIDYLIKEKWIKPQLIKKFNLDKMWVEEYISNEYSTSIFERINSEFYFSIGFLFGSITIIVLEIFNFWLNIIFLIIIFIGAIGLFFKGISTGKKNFLLLSSIVRFGLYQSNYSKWYPWIKSPSERINKQNKVIEERKVVVKQLQENLLKKDYITFSHNFEVNVLNIARSNGEEFVQELKGPKQYQTYLDLQWTYDFILQLPSKMENFYITAFEIINSKNSEIKTLIEKIAEIIDENQQILDIFKDLNDYILNNTWFKSDFVIIENNGFTRESINQLIEQRALKQVGQKETPRGKYLYLFLTLISNIYDQLNSIDSFKVEVENRNSIQYLTTIHIPRDGTNSLIVPIYQLEVFLFNYQFRINNKYVYGSYRSEPLLRFFSSMLLDPPNESIVEFLKLAPPLVDEIYKSNFSDFMERRRDKNKGFVFFSYNAMINQVSNVFDEISDTITKIENIENQKP